MINFKDLKFNSHATESKIFSELAEFYDAMLIVLKINRNINVYIRALEENEFVEKNKSGVGGVDSYCENNNIYIRNNNLEKEGVVAILKHEIVHALINSVCKNCDYWISEGCAVYFSGQYYELLLKVKSKFLSLDIISIEDLKRDFKFTEFYYCISSIYIKYLYECYPLMFYKLVKGEIEVYEIEKDAFFYVNA